MKLELNMNGTGYVQSARVKTYDRCVVKSQTEYGYIIFIYYNSLTFLTFFCFFYVTKQIDLNHFLLLHLLLIF